MISDCYQVPYERLAHSRSCALCCVLFYTPWNSCSLLGTTVILKDHFPGSYKTHVWFLLPLPNPVPQPQCLLFISSDDICHVYFKKRMTLSTCEGILLMQGFQRSNILLTETSSPPTLCQGVNSLCPNAVLQLQNQNPSHLQAEQTTDWHNLES